MALLRTFSDRLNRFANPGSFALSGLGLAAVLVLLKVLETPFGVAHIKKVSGGVRILDMQGFYGADHAFATLDVLGEAGRQAYLNFLIVGDVLLPLAYGTFLALGLGLGLRGLVPNPAHPLRRLNTLPVLAVALDLLENGLILVLLTTYPERADGVATTAGVVTATKRVVLMTCLWGAAAALAGGGLANALRRFRA